MEPHEDSPNDAPSSLLLPTLCHPHIHLDKPYLLTCNHSEPGLPDYSDLAPKSGSFQEALVNTSKAKSRFTPEDLYLRGSQLLATSYTQGVTSARSFVEVDHVTQSKTLEVVLRLKRDFAAPRPGHPNGLVDVQLCVFAQDPIFSTEYVDENRGLIEEALAKYAGKGVDVLGSTPYVEQSREASERNIEWAISTALKYDLHLDFHLDYSLDTKPEDALVWQVLQTLIASNWQRNRDGQNSRTVVFGHCTALTNFANSDLKELKSQINDNNLPVYFVGLPTSDVYMMGRPPSSSTGTEAGNVRLDPNQKTLDRPRGTLNPVTLWKDHGIRACLGVNNVGNAFTPFGTGDPLQLASWGVGLYHAGTAADAQVLYDAVSTGAREAIGLQSHGAQIFGISDGEGSQIKQGTKIPKRGLMLVQNEEWVGCPGHLGVKVPARQRRSVRDVVWDVPEVGLRRVIQ